MKAIKLTSTEYQILLNPTRIQEWGEQQAIARKVQAQVSAITTDTTFIDTFDIDVINKAIEVNHEGTFIASASAMRGGWPTTEWEISTKKLKRHIRVGAS